MERDVPSVGDVEAKVNGSLGNAARPIVETEIARDVYEMRVDPFGEGMVIGRDDRVGQAIEGVMEAAVEKTPINSLNKIPGQKPIVPY